MTKAGYEITARFICKDPEWDVNYAEHDEHGTRTSVFKIYVDTLVVGSLERWDSPDEPMEESARKRVLDRLAAWAFGPRDGKNGRPTTLQAIVGGDGAEPLRAPGVVSSQPS